MILSRNRDIRTVLFRPLGVLVDFMVAIYPGLIISLVVGWSVDLDIGLTGRWASRFDMWVQLMTYFLIYAVVVESWLGKTPRKMTFQMKIVDSAGDKPSPVRIIVRNAVKALEMTVFPLALLAYLVTGKSLGDRIAKTSVVSTR